MILLEINCQKCCNTHIWRIILLFLKHMQVDFWVLILVWLESSFSSSFHRYNKHGYRNYITHITHNSRTMYVVSTLSLRYLNSHWIRYCGYTHLSGLKNLLSSKGCFKKALKFADSTQNTYIYIYCFKCVFAVI